MAIVSRHPLDERLGFDLVPIDWSQAGSSGEKARSEAHEYQLTSQGPTKFIVARRHDDVRRYNVELSRDGRRGWCSCEAFIFKTKRGKGPCVHLCLANNRRR